MKTLAKEIEIKMVWSLFAMVRLYASMECTGGGVPLGHMLKSVLEQFGTV